AEPRRDPAQSRGCLRRARCFPDAQQPMRIDHALVEPGVERGIGREAIQHRDQPIPEPPTPAGTRMQPPRLRPEAHRFSRFRGFVFPLLVEDPGGAAHLLLATPEPLPGHRRVVVYGLGRGIEHDPAACPLETQAEVEVFPAVAWVALVETAKPL